MKKIFSFLCALTIVLSASAAPRFGLTREAKGAQAQESLTAPVRKAAPKAPAKLNGEEINIEANNLAVDLSYFDLYLQYLGYGFFRIEGGTDEYAVSAELYTADENYYTTYSTADESIALSVNETALTVSSAEFRSTEKGDQFVATAVDEEGNTYNINLTFFAPSEPKDTVAIDFGAASFFKYYAEDGDYYLEGSRPDYYVTLDIYSEELAGEYTKDDFYLQYTGLWSINAGDSISKGSAFDVNAKIVEKEGVFDINANLFLADSVLYQIHMTYTKPVATDTIQHTFSEPVTIDDFGGDFYFKAVDDKYALFIDYYSTTITGDFKLADMYEKYCALYKIAGKDTTYVAYADLGLVVTEDETGYDLKVSYLANDSHCYLFTLRSEKAKADETIQVELDDAAYTDISSYSWYYGFSHYVEAAPADSSFVIALAVKQDEFVGTFTNEDLNANYSGIQIGKEFFQIASAEFTVTEGLNGSYTLEGWLLAKNNVKYEFVIKTAEKEEQAIENIKLSEETQKVIMDGSLFIIRDNKMFNAQGVRVR
jgi:hypothetical protein